MIEVRLPNMNLAQECNYLDNESKFKLEYIKNNGKLNKTRQENGEFKFKPTYEINESWLRDQN